MKKAIAAAVVSVWALITVAEDVRFIGEDGSGKNGALNTPANWQGGILPSGNKTGLVTETVNVWVGQPLTSLSMRQTGGLIKAPTGLQMRGGPSGSGISTIYVVDDPNTNYMSYVNLDLPKTNALTLWSQFGEKCELSLLSGHIEAGQLTMNAPDKVIINIRDGIFHAGKMVTGKGVVNLLAGGTGTMTVDALGCALGELKVNFEAGNKGCFTFGQKTDGVSAGGVWQYMVNNRQIMIDGKVVKDPDLFQITTEGLSTTIKLAPTP